MFTEQFSLFGNPNGNRNFFGLMQTKKDGFTVKRNVGLPFPGGLMRVNSKNATARIALRLTTVHPVLLMRDFAKIFNSVIGTITIDVINLIRRRIFVFAQCPDYAMRQISPVANADADVTTAQNRRASDSAGLDATLRCLADQQAITYFKQTLQFCQWRQRLNLGCHLSQGEVSTGQGVSSTAASQFYTGAFQSC